MSAKMSDPVIQIVDRYEKNVWASLRKCWQGYADQGENEEYQRYMRLFHSFSTSGFPHPTNSTTAIVVISMCFK